MVFSFNKHTSNLLTISLLMVFNFDVLASNEHTTKGDQNNETKELIHQLYNCGSVKTGCFKLKNGTQSPIYLDLRTIISYPKLLQSLSHCLWALIEPLKFDVICGVPYTALPIATTISTDHQIPMIIKRKEAKDYGTKKIIEGVFSKDNTCILIEDVVTTGGSVLETIEVLEKEGLKVKDIVVCIDREQNGVKNLQEKGFNVHVLFTISEIIDELFNSKCIDSELHLNIKNYIDSTKFPTN